MLIHILVCIPGGFVHEWGGKQCTANTHTHTHTHSHLLQQHQISSKYSLRKVSSIPVQMHTYAQFKCNSSFGCSSVKIKNKLKQPESEWLLFPFLRYFFINTHHNTHWLHRLLSNWAHLTKVEFPVFNCSVKSGTSWVSNWGEPERAPH